MTKKKNISRKVLIIRWVARIWSLVVLVIALLIAFSPDPYATGDPLPIRDWLFLSLWSLAIFGLLIAWFWELVGGIITITVMFLREIIWIIMTGRWMVNFLIVWVALVPPAILFIIAWRLEKSEVAKP
jgi:hypothetical protein